MSHQIITRMTYNAKTRQIETWQHSSNVCSETDHFHALDVKTDEQMLFFIKLVADREWQTRKWHKEFEILFQEYPELNTDSYCYELEGKPWEEYCAIRNKYEQLAKSKCSEIATRFRQLENLHKQHMNDTITIGNREIALMAFDRLCKEDKKDSALKLARCLLYGASISLGIGDIDWDIDLAIQQCGGEPRTGYRYTAHFHFNRNTEMEKERYDGIMKELYG